MALEKLEHCLLLSSDLEATRAFYCDVLGLTEGFRPEMKFEGFWIYLGDTAVIHVADQRSFVESRVSSMDQTREVMVGSGAIDHIAFTGTDPQPMMDRLKQHKVTFEVNEIPQVQLIQLFATDPDGIRVEMNFSQS